MAIASGTSADVVDQIYEAALVPEKWPTVLDRVSERVGSVGGALLATGDRHPPRWVASETVAPALRAYTSGEAWKDNSRAQQALSSNGTGFSRDIDLWTAEELERYRVSDERSPHGLGWQIGSIIPMSSGDTVIFTFDRRFDDGPHNVAMRDAADSMRPHLARAGLLAARLGLERAQTMVATLAAIGLPAAVLTASGRVLAANGLLQDLTSVFLMAAHDGLVITDAAAHALLQQSLEGHDRRNPVVRSIPVMANDDRGPVVVHLLPVRGVAHDLFTGAEILIVATSVSARSALPSVSLLHGLFDLSPAEARLAALLAAGEPLKGIAAKSGIQFSTARSYLESIFRKTGTHQQSQLVALLKSAQPFSRQP
jgi:DNA-binding CsgD family transcriptional regulator